MPSTLTITARGGQRTLLVPAAARAQWGLDDARAHLRAALRHDRQAAFALRTLAERTGLVHTDDLDAVIEHVATAIASGALVPLVLQDDLPRGLRPRLYRDGQRSDDWADAVPLSSLQQRESTAEYGWVSIELVSHRGVPFAGTEVTLIHCDGRRDRVVLDSLGRHAARAVALPGPTRVILPARLDPPAGAMGLDGFTRDPGDVVVSRQPTTPLSLGTLDRHHRVVVQAEPSVTEVPIDGWAQGSSVMRWGGMRPRTDGTVGTTRGALRLGLWLGRGRTMCVAGHTDPLGQDADNEALSAERATSVYLFAAGRLDEWAEHAAAHATELDLQCALTACHAILGLGSAALDDDQAIEAARRRLRSGAELAQDGPIGPDDWRAIADTYDTDLAALLATDRGGLAEIRGTIRWTESPTVGLGERHPRAAAELTDAVGIVALPHRRGSLLVFDDTDDAQAAARAGDMIYDGTYRRTVLVVPGEVLVQVTIARPTRESIARARAWIDVGPLGASQYVADADGTIRFTALAGDAIHVVAAFDADGLGTLVSSGMATP